nr:PREDICTED: uncharacterized protein LOC105679009 [Linepithema humile]
MSDIPKMLMSSVAITAIVVVGYKVIKSTMKRNPRSYKQAREKVKTERRRDVDNEYSTLHNPNWKEIGQVTNLLIYLVKSSKMSVSYNSFKFCDYGMCTENFGTDIWDGMFAVYNKRTEKFEDSRKYPALGKLETWPSGHNEVTLRTKSSSELILNMQQYRNSANVFVKETWNETLEAFSDSDVHVNTWLKDVIQSNEINETDEDIILSKMNPRNPNSTEGIKNNWFRFVQGYEAMEKDETGKFITLPRFVLITMQTTLKLSNYDFINAAPNIMIKTDEKVINAFEEKTWDWIKIGNDVILRKLKPVPSTDKTVQHCGIYCALWSGGYVEKDDKIYIYSSDTQ